MSITKNQIPFVFKGTFREYFGIWLVNTILTLLTLGVYSAWAKVRTQRYFYGKTFLDDVSFDYRASPLAVLKGWGIAAVLFVGYSILSELWPVTNLAFMILMLIALPWLINAAMSFKCFNSAYRNIRFTFSRKYREAAVIYLLLPFLSLLTLGLLFPYFTYRSKKFVITQAGFGQSLFEFTACSRDFYRLYSMASLWMLAWMLLFACAWYAVLSLYVDIPDWIRMKTVMISKAAGPFPEIPEWTGMAVILSIVLVYFVFYAFLQTQLTNLIWNHIRINECQFRSRMKILPLLWIYLTNALAILLSMGLLTPWARIRLMRYRLNTRSLKVPGDLDGFVVREQKKISAAGQEIGDMFDVDIGL